jgi:hypothetical protein
MAEIFKMKGTKLRAWRGWLKNRPPIVADLARRFPPNKLFRLKNTGHRVFVLAYDENGTLRVMVSGKYNFVVFERQVFGIEPNDLEECDLPSPKEMTGSLNVRPEPPVRLR